MIRVSSGHVRLYPGSQPSQPASCMAIHCIRDLEEKLYNTLGRIKLPAVLYKINDDYLTFAV